MLEAVVCGPLDYKHEIPFFLSEVLKIRSSNFAFPF